MPQHIVRILFLTHRLPYAPNRGDRIRAYYLLKEIAKSAEVDLLSLVHSDDEERHVRDLADVAGTVATVRVQKWRAMAMTALALPGSRPATHTMLDGWDLATRAADLVKQRRPDVIFAYCTALARLALHPELQSLPMVLDMVDVDSRKWADLSAKTHPPRSWLYRREAHLLARFERTIVQHAHATLLTTEAEREILAAMVPKADIRVVQNGVNTTAFARTGAAGTAPIVIFCGVMNYEPNVQAAVWLATEIWPLVLRAQPEARLQLVGADPSPRVRALTSDTARIEVTGSVPDVRPYLWSAAVAVAPLLTARGVQNKVLEAVAAGLPTVVTPVVHRGLPFQVRSACSVADTAPAFASAILSLLTLPPERRVERAGLADIASLSWENQLREVPALLRAAAGAREAS